MSAFADHKKFRDSLPDAPKIDRIYTPELIAKEAAERVQIILAIPDPKQRGLKILEYVATLSPVVGAFAGPQGAAIGAAVSTLATIAHKMIETETITPDDVAGVGTTISSIVDLFKKADATTVGTAGLNAVAALKNDVLPNGHVNTNPGQHVPAGHTDTNHKPTDPHKPTNHHS